MPFVSARLVERQEIDAGVETRAENIITTETEEPRGFRFGRDRDRHEIGGNGVPDAQEQAADVGQGGNRV